MLDLLESDDFALLEALQGEGKGLRRLISVFD
jgi:hypothetical protein